LNLRPEKFYTALQTTQIAVMPWPMSRKMGTANSFEGMV